MSLLKPRFPSRGEGSLTADSGVGGAVMMPVAVPGIIFTTRVVASLLACLIVLRPVIDAPVVVQAAQATPETSPTPGPVNVRPACEARQATAAGLVSLLQQPVPEDLQPLEPVGEALPPNERAPAGDVIARWQQCLASGNVRGLLGLFTADGVRRLLAQREPYVGGPAGLVVSILAVNDVLRLPDGRLTARVTIDPSGSGTTAPETLLFVFKDEGGELYIDNLYGPGDLLGATRTEPVPPGGMEPPLLRRPIAPGPEVPVLPPGPNVPMRGGNAARSGLQPGPVPGQQPVELWRAPIGWHSDAQPVVSRGLVYVGGFSLGERLPLLEAIDTASGGVRWQSTAPVAWADFANTPALAGDLLFAPVEAPVSGVLALSASTGEALWYAPFGFTSVTAPALDAESIYLAGWGVRNPRDRVHNDTSGMVIALDQRTGRERWRFLSPSRFGPVALGAQLLFIPSDHGVYALNRSTGQKHWQARFSPGLDDTPTVIGDLVVFTGADITTGQTGIFALDAASGALRWRVDLDAVPGTRSGTAAAGDTVVVSWWESSDGEPGRGVPTLRAYALADGSERWVYRADSDVATDEPIGVGSVTEPVMSGSTVLFGVSIRAPASGATGILDGLYAVAMNDGVLQWHAVADTPIGSSPAVLDGTIYAMGGLRPRGDATRGYLIAFGSGS